MIHLFSSVSLKSDRIISMEGIRTLWVKTPSQDIYFYKGNDNLEVKEYLNDLTVPAKVEKTADALHLEIDFTAMKLLGSMKHERMEIYLPKNFFGQIYAESASGNIYLEGEWNLENVQIQAASGNIISGMLSAQHFLLKSKSGNITIDAANGDRQFSTVSGNLEVRSGSGDTKADTVSGNLRINQIDGQAVLNTVSGDLRADYHKIIGENKIHSVSGNIHVTTSTSNQYALEVSTKSGNLKVNPDEFKSVNRHDHHVSALKGCDNRVNIETSLVVTSVSGNVIVI